MEGKGTYIIFSLGLILTAALGGYLLGSWGYDEINQHSSIPKRLDLLFLVVFVLAILFFMGGVASSMINFIFMCNKMPKEETRTPSA